MSAFTPTRGGVWDRVAKQLAQAPRESSLRRTVPRGKRPFTEDRWKRDRLIGVGAAVVIPDYGQADHLLAWLLDDGQEDGHAV